MAGARRRVSRDGVAELGAVPVGGGSPANGGAGPQGHRWHDRRTMRTHVGCKAKRRVWQRPPWSAGLAAHGQLKYEAAQLRRFDDVGLRRLNPQHGSTMSQQ
jgi:hypothetical protein